MATQQHTKQQALQRKKVAQGAIEKAVKQSSAIIEAFGFKPEVLLRVAFNAMATTPSLSEADPTSLRNAMLVCCQRGLMPDGESCALIPFKNAVEVVPMVGGLLDIARREIPGIEVSSGVVWQGDDYEYSTGLELVLRVRPQAGIQRNPNTLVGAWAVVKFPDGQIEHEWMWREEILHVMNTTRGGQKGLWNKYFMRACRKTPLKALLKRLPIRNTDALRTSVDDVVGRMSDGRIPDYDEGETIPGHFVDQQPAVPLASAPPQPAAADADRPPVEAYGEEEAPPATAPPKPAAKRSTGRRKAAPKAASAPPKAAPKAASAPPKQAQAPPKPAPQPAADAPKAPAPQAEAAPVEAASVPLLDESAPGSDMEQDDFYQGDESW